MDPVLFADIEVGRDLGAVTVPVVAEEVADYRRALGLAAPGPVPPTFCVVLLRAMRAALPAPPGGIHAGQTFDFVEPMRVGDEVTVSSVVVDAFERRGRRNVVLDTLFTRADGALLARGTARRLWAL